MRVLQCGANILAQKLPAIEYLVEMATVISKKVLQDFLLVTCKEQTIEFTKKFKLRGNAPKMNRLKATLTRVIDEGCAVRRFSTLIVKKESSLMRTLCLLSKSGKTTSFVKMKDQAKHS